MRREDERQVEGEQDAAPEKAHGIRGRGHTVDLLRRGDMGKERVVKLARDMVPGYGLRASGGVERETPGSKP